MQQLLTQLGDLIFPPSPEVLLLRTHPVESFSKRGHRQLVQNCQCLSSYTDPIIQAAIKANKFQHYRPAARALAALVDNWAARHTEPLIFVPIPLGQKRQRARGHNQVESVLKQMSTRPRIVTALTRIRETEPQTNLNKTARLQNIADAFAGTAAVSNLPNGTRVVLIDDVLSTGATMKAARASLAPHLPPDSTLTCVAIAH